MKTIWKYSLEARHINKIMMPKGSEILRFSHQDDNICFWAILDTEKSLEERTFAVFATGQDIGEQDWIYLDTVQIKLPKNHLLTELVWHIFEIPNVEKRALNDQPR